MTKVTLHYELQRPLTEDDFAGVAKAHSTYGIARLQVAPALDRITVDYDASRLTRTDVEKILVQHGVPIHTEAQAVA